MCFLVLLQKQLSENVFIDERRPVLLCDEKLCLRALQDLFSLTIVEMLHGESSLWRDRCPPFKLSGLFRLEEGVSPFASIFSKLA